MHHQCLADHANHPAYPHPHFHTAAGNFGTVFVDQAYWQSAIAAKPSSSHKGYLLGGLLWFCIPFTLATTLGIASR